MISKMKEPCESYFITIGHSAKAEHPVCAGIKDRLHIFKKLL
jgi:hypothetical protein